MKLKNLSLLVALVFVAITPVFQSTVMAQGKLKGVNVEIEDGWIRSSFGCRCIRVTVSLSPRRPAPETMNFNIVATEMRGGSENSVATRPIVLKQGATSVTEEIYIPQSSSMQYGYQTTIHVESDGNLHYNYGRDLARKYDYVNYYGGQAGMPTMLIISSSVKSNLVSKFIKTRRNVVESVGDALLIDEAKFPALQVLSQYYPENQNQVGAINNNPTASDMLQSPSIHALKPSDVPRSWLGLTAAELLLVSLADLNTVAKDQTQMQAIRKWVAAGGSLIVFDCGQGLEKANSVREILDGRKSLSAERKNPWKIPGKKTEGRNEFLTHKQTENYPYYMGNVPAKQLTNEKNSALGDLSDWTILEPGSDLGAKTTELGFPFAMYRHVLGRVTVVKDDMQNWKLSDWKRLLNANMIEGRTLRERLGSGSATIPSTTMAISDVGKPPVTGFKILIGLFVLLVGPVAYIVLRRQRRLQLLFAIVPAISVAACLGLMLFAILSDGFQNRGRMRTFTAIDHSRQQAVSYARHSHYQGVQPKTYRFEIDEAVFNSRARTSPRSVYRQEQEMSLVNGGDMRPRMPHQFVAVNSFNTTQGLILIAGDEESVPQIRNQFETPVRLAVFTTPNGCFFVENVASGATATGVSALDDKATKVKRMNSDTRKLIRELLTEISPNVKDDFLQLSTYSSYPYYGNVMVSEEARFEADYQMIQMAGSTLSQIVKQPGNYIAILEEYSEITIPQDNIDYKNKIHIIHGKW